MSAAERRWLPLQPLTPEAFRPFGDVIDLRPEGASLGINQGTARRYSDLARIDTLQQQGRPGLGVVRALPRALPLQLLLMERHQLGSQAFVPLSPHRYLVVVAPAGPVPDTAALQCFVCQAGQGINYAPGTWHHPLLALQGPSDFLVVDRLDDSGAVDCEEHSLALANLWIGAAPDAT